MWYHAVPMKSPASSEAADPKRARMRESRRETLSPAHPVTGTSRDNIMQKQTLKKLMVLHQGTAGNCWTASPGGRTVFQSVTRGGPTAVVACNGVTQLTAEMSLRTPESAKNSWFGLTEYPDPAAQPLAAPLVTVSLSAVTVQGTLALVVKHLPRAALRNFSQRR